MSKIDETIQREIAGRATTLVERLTADHTLDTGGRVEIDGDERLSTWADQYPDDASFERRLETLGVDREACVAAFEKNRLAPDEPLPDWVERVRAVADYVSQDERVLAAAAERPRSDRAFDSVVRVVSEYLRAEEVPEEVADSFGDDAIDDAVDWFERRFYARFVRVLFVEFKTFVASRDEDLAFADPEEFDDPPTELYETFRSYLHDGGFADLCFDYPVFARLLAVQIRQWRQHLTELAERITADEATLADRFSEDDSLGRVVELEPLADDTHGDGRAVTRVAFENGTTVVYKPRSVTAGRVFYELVDTVASRTEVPSFDTPTYLERDGYGWMEWIEHEPCPDTAAVERYYRRAGALICLAYLLEFTDCHYENVIAAGEHPTILDAETVFHPHVGAARQPGPAGTPLSADSVLLSMLPPFERSDVYDQFSGPSVEIAGIGTSAEPASFESLTTPRVEAPNTDVVSVEHEPGQMRREKNVPAVDGTPQPPDDYCEEILDGFCAVYDAILEDSAVDLAAELESLEAFENRVVYRATRQYASHIKSLAGRDPLRDGVLFGVQLEQLAVPFATGQTTDPPWELFTAERAALRRLDPPRFTSQPDGLEIRGPSGDTGVTATQSGLDRVSDRIESLSPDDRQRQIELLRGCFGVTPAPREPPQTDTPRYVDDDRLVAAARTAEERIRAAANRSDDGQYHWSCLVPWNESERLTVRPADSSLYVGTLGIALFAGTLFRVTGEATYRQFARDITEPVAQAVREGRSLPSLNDHGGATGVGGVAYGLATVGDLVESSSIRNSARAVADTVTTSFVDSDTTYDVVGGAAGTALGLLGAYDRTGDDALLAAAAECGDHLLDDRVETAADARAWETLPASQPLCGFAHGTAGIAYALARLGDTTDDPRYTDAALEAVEYESAQYDSSLDNWPDFRPDSGRRDLDQWCHGRSGIGLARLGTLRHVDDGTVRRDFERALGGIQPTLSQYDHLCCGNAGRAAFHVAAGDRLPESAPTGRELIGGVVDRAGETFRTLTETRAVCEPSLFHGAAGVGFIALRAAAPEKTPEMVLWR